MSAEVAAANDLLDDEEEECRVCRGPAEEGRPLYKPCKCSGSIGLTHQDCLQSWLRVQRGNGSCELCKEKFRFTPQYDKDAPDRLPAIQVLVGLSRRAIAKWLPFTARIVFAASLWLVVAPIVTAYLYHSWMNRPSIILERFSWKLLTTDLVSGAVVAAYIIISFLSLMSFADFLRVEWQQRGIRPGDRNHEQNANQQPPEPQPNEIDDGVWLHVQREILEQPRSLRRQRDIRSLRGLRTRTARQNSPGVEDGEIHVESNSDSDDDSFVPPRDGNDDDDDDSSISYLDVGVEDASSDEDERQEVPRGDRHPNPMRFPPGQQEQPQAQRAPQQQAGRRENGRFDRPFDFDQEENVDMDINIALDELLGVRGPLGVVLRNLLWLLAFNAIYVGFFCFVPRTVGRAVMSIVLNITSSSRDSLNKTEAYSELAKSASLGNIIYAINAESEEEKTLFRFRDLAMVTVGYLACATAAWIGRFLWLVMTRRMGLFPHGRRGVGPLNLDAEMMDEINRLMNGDAPNLEDDPPGVALNVAVGCALEFMISVVKVGILLFLKMFFLPILLGLCLDASVATLFRYKLEDRIMYAGQDLFSFVLLHWVCGITFMLLVTVSVLQFREVAHPDLLSQVIRPQEPQPDLLGNLLHEGASTHAKRMAMSLIIYAVLWALYIFLPAQLAAWSGILNFLPMMELKLFYPVTPKLQVPLELLFFHLCMLGLLERYKNGIGEMQHHWLKLMTKHMGIQECILPLEVSSFQYIGSRPVFAAERTIDELWYDLASDGAHREEILAKREKDFKRRSDHSEEFPFDDQGETKENGERVLRIGSDYIRLPVLLPGTALRSKSILMPTKIGRYRLMRGPQEGNQHIIQLWVEQTGRPIPRPPEGWDDLGVEPPDIQGRWAYGREKKSAIEGGVAGRIHLFHKNMGWMSWLRVSSKLAALFILSWCATTVLLSLAILIPPAVGRLVYFIFRVPERWIHDPLAFAIGFLICFPLISASARACVVNGFSPTNFLREWLSRFRAPPFRKSAVLALAMLLWLITAPLFLGTAYDLAFVKPDTWFSGELPLVDGRSVAMDWITGTVLLHIWTFLCVAGVLTGRFRVAVLEGLVIPDDNVERELRVPWQGARGRMARFLSIIGDCLLDWNYDTVDPTALLHDVAVPVCLELFWTVSIPLATAIGFRLYLPQLSGSGRACIVRLLGSIVSLSQAARVWQDQLKSWFEAAHKSARDDLYLVGEILMNYGE